MTLSPGTATPVAAPRPPIRAARTRTASVALAASALTLAGLLAAPPWGDRLDSSADDFLAYDQLVDGRDAAWAGLLVDGFAYAVLALALSAAVLHLARERGRVAALVGAVLTTAGGILFAMGAAGFATFTWFATAPGLAEGAGPSLVDSGDDHVVRLLGADMAGFVLYTAGTLFLAAALIRARAVPLVGVVVFVALTLAQFVVPNDVVDHLQIGQMVLLVGLAAVVWRRARA
ncbi:hypothetical protein ACI797_11300 [Geodermatophilus sp. SYSU D00691]